MIFNYVSKDVREGCRSNVLNDRTVNTLEMNVIDDLFVKKKYSSALGAYLGAKYFLACKKIRIMKNCLQSWKADFPTVVGFQNKLKVRQQKIKVAGVCVAASVQKAMTNRRKDSVEGCHLLYKQIVGPQLGFTSYPRSFRRHPNRAGQPPTRYRPTFSRGSKNGPYWAYFFPGVTGHSTQRTQHKTIGVAPFWGDYGAGTSAFLLE